MMKRLVKILAAAAFVIATAAVSSAHADGLKSRGVFTMSNDTDRNKVLAYDRAADGTLMFAGGFQTGGKGTGGGLGNQSALALSRGGGLLVVVNAGDNTISSFRVTPKGLVRVSNVASGGTRPVSVAIEGRLAYVLNAGSDSIAGFRLSGRGELSPIQNSIKPLSAAGVGAAQIAFGQDGDAVIVTEKATSRITTYTLNDNGVPGTMMVRASLGQTPFGFALDRNGHVIVSEAVGGMPGASSVSSYDLDDEGGLSPISGSVPSGQTAACWVAISRDRAYVSNAGSGTISSYGIQSDGMLRIEQAVAGLSAGPIDLAFSKDERFLYVLSTGSHAIDVFQVDKCTGSLTRIGSAPIGPFANGLAAR
jgi:6-phosphogluconolactonase